jgi:hypothetical protein
MCGRFILGDSNWVLLVAADGTEVRAVVDEQHEEGLTRENVTAAVHYLRFEFSEQAVEAFAAGPVQLRIDHPNYLEAVELGDATHEELLSDLR